MQRGLVLALVVAFEVAVLAFLFAPRDQLDVGPPTPSVLPRPSPMTPPPETQPGALKEVRCHPGFGHGVSYKIDGDRHCFVEASSPTPTPSPSAAP